MSFSVHIRSSDWSDAQEIWLIENNDGAIFNISYDGKGLFTKTRINEGEAMGDAKPFLKLPGPMARQILPQIVEKLSASGFERPSESTLRGKCEAMSAHLSDLRHLLKLPKRTTTQETGENA